MSDGVPAAFFAAVSTHVGRPPFFLRASGAGAGAGVEAGALPLRRGIGSTESSQSRDREGYLYS